MVRAELGTVEWVASNGAEGVAVGAEIVIRGGTVVDGTGAPGRLADVAVSDGRIVGIGGTLSGERGSSTRRARSSRPASSTSTPTTTPRSSGTPRSRPSSFHGVTTVVAGNCGFSIAPTRPDGVELIARTLENVEDMNVDTLAAGIPWDFETFPQYLDAVEQRGVGLNYGGYVGHTAVRLFVMGDDAYERAATADELATMQQVVAEAMAGGAIGFATSASPTHNGADGRPVPSRVADLAELEALLDPVRDAGRGVVALLPGGVISNAEVFDLQRRVGRPITWTALLTIKGMPYHEGVIEAHDAAWADGVEVWPQVSCRPLVFQMNLLEPFTLNMRPSFAALMDVLDGGASSCLRRPCRGERRPWSEMQSGFAPVNWAALSVAESAAQPDLVGRKIIELAEERGVTPLDAMLDISLDDGLHTRFSSVLANDDPDGIAWLLPRDNVLLGLADAGAHVSQLCDACFATDLLGNWVRDARSCRSSEPSTSSPQNRPACSASPIGA